MITDRKSYDIRLKDIDRFRWMRELEKFVDTRDSFPWSFQEARSGFFSFLFSPFLFFSFLFFFSSHALVCMRSRACELSFRLVLSRSLLVLSFSFGEFLPDSRKLRAVSILLWFVREYFVTPGIFRACIYAALSLSVNADFRICISFPIANRGIKRDRRK